MGWTERKPGEPVQHRLFEEGFATVSSTLVLAGRSRADPGGQRGLGQAVAAFFHGGAGHSELPERCGYLAGLKVLRELNRAYRLDELIT